MRKFWFAFLSLIWTSWAITVPGQSRTEWAKKSSDSCAAAIRVIQHGLASQEHPQDAVHRVSSLRHTAREALRLCQNNPLVQDILRVAVSTSENDESIERSIDRLDSALHEVLQLLEFRPVMEAPLPQDFPPPTPIGEIGLKDYPSHRLARTTIEGNSDAAFWMLFRHIEKHQIAMTAPVQMTYVENRDGVLQSDTMAFLYRNLHLGKIGPAGDANVMDIEPQRVVSVGLRGDTTDEAIAKARSHLLDWLRRHSNEFSVDGKLRVLGYNSPMIPVKRRYFEVQFPITIAEDSLEKSLTEPERPE